MNDKIEERLTELRAELEAGRRMLGDVEARRAELKTTLVRISGAIQVLEELSDRRADADAALTQGLEFMTGEPDAAGMRTFSLAGSL